MKAFVLKLVSFLVLVTALTACSSPGPKSMKVGSTSDEIQTIEVGYGEIHQVGYYVVIESNGKGWRVTDISRDRITKRPNDQSEILFFNHALTFAQPVFERAKDFDGSAYECSPLIDNKSIYTPCQSKLTSSRIGMSIGKNIFAAFLTFGLASGYHVKVDNKKTARAIQSSNALNLLVKNKDAIDAEYEEKRTQQRIQQQRVAAEVIKRERQQRELELQRKRAMLPQIQKIGATVCVDKNSSIGKIRYSGYVENIANTRIQVRITNANFIGTSLSPGGFRPHIIWDEAPVCQPKHEPTDFEITYKSGCLGERNAKANHSS